MTTVKKIICAAAAVSAVLAGVAAFVLGRYYVDNKKPNFGESYVLYVRPDMSDRHIHVEKSIRVIPMRQDFTNHRK